MYLRQTLKDFEERRVPIDVRAAVFYRTLRVIFLIWTQKDVYGTLSAGQVDGQTLEDKKNKECFNESMNLKQATPFAFLLNL